MGRVERPFNFLSLWAYLKAINADMANKSSIVRQKANITLGEWNKMTKFCKERGLVEIKGFGKHRGRRPVITTKGVEVYEFLKGFLVEYSNLLGVIYGRDKETDTVDD